MYVDAAASTSPVSERWVKGMPVFHVCMYVDAATPVAL